MRPTAGTLRWRRTGSFTDQGYVCDTGDSFHEYYDGERGSIPTSTG